MTQTELALSRATDPLSSHLAADSVPIERDEDTVLRFLALHPGSTARELASYFRARHGGNEEVHYAKFHKRCPGLRAKGKAVNGELRRCRISGRLSQTWSAVHG